MSVKNKQQLKQEFLSGSKITQAKIEDLIDSSVNKVDDLSIDANGNVGIGITPSSGVKLEVNGTIKVPYKESTANASISIGDDTFHDGNIYALRFGESETNQLGMGTYTSTKRVFSDSSNGLGIHVHSDAEFSVKSSSWTNLFGIRGGTGNAYFKGNVGIGTMPSAGVK